MNKKRFCFILALAIVGISSLPSVHYAEESSLGQTGGVQVTNGGPSSLIDPENPEISVDPGEGPSTEGTLRFDYAPNLRFGTHTIKEGNRVYKALAQQFVDETRERGSFVQLTDQRSSSSGWTLQMKQENQFRHTKTGEELKGASLSLDNGWASSSGTSEAPIVTRETILLNGIGTAYEVAKAEPGKGTGVWSIAFGASQDNPKNQKPTLAPLVDEQGKAIIDAQYNKPAYSNSAITLSIPEKINITPGSYVTKITWLLAELP